LSPIVASTILGRNAVSRAEPIIPVKAVNPGRTWIALLTAIGIEHILPRSRATVASKGLGGVRALRAASAREMLSHSFFCRPLPKVQVWSAYKAVGLEKQRRLAARLPGSRQRANPQSKLGAGAERAGHSRSTCSPPEKSRILSTSNTAATEYRTEAISAMVKRDVAAKRKGWWPPTTKAFASARSRTRLWWLPCVSFYGTSIQLAAAARIRTLGNRPPHCVTNRVHKL
jgi:hypothetical protein